jgi:hypothetical protein
MSHLAVGRLCELTSGCYSFVTWTCRPDESLLGHESRWKFLVISVFVVDFYGQVESGTGRTMSKTK